MKVLLFGATGSAGGSVLRACLSAPDVEEVRAVTRRPLRVQHERLSELAHEDFADDAPIGAAFTGIDACLFCLGISVSQVSDEAQYRRITHDFALAAARTMKERSPASAFHFISGQNTRLDSRFMWARVKAETERDLAALVSAVSWRPSFIDGESSDRAPRLYQALRPIARILLKPFPSWYVSGEEIGRAMLQATREGIRDRVIENAEIRDIARRSR
jgi:uncharacterized protein YbjT (DUF2867 family)